MNHKQGLAAESLLILTEMCVWSQCTKVIPMLLYAGKCLREKDYNRLCVHEKNKLRELGVCCVFHLCYISQFYSQSKRCITCVPQIQLLNPLIR